jgi:hypothetical protein
MILERRPKSREWIDANESRAELAFVYWSKSTKVACMVKLSFMTNIY